MTVSLQGRAFKPVEADLWGYQFQTVSLTRSKAKAFAEQAAQLDDIDDEGTDNLDKAIAAIGGMLDVLLTPADGKRSKPSKLIVDKWQADEVSFAELLGFVEDLQAQNPT